MTAPRTAGFGRSRRALIAIAAGVATTLGAGGIAAATLGAAGTSAAAHSSRPAPLGTHRVQLASGDGTAPVCVWDVQLRFSICQHVPFS